MAKQKKDEIVANPEVKTPPVDDATEALNKIKDEQLSKYLDEPVKDGKVVEDEEIAEYKVEEKPEEEKEPEVKEPEFDKEAYKKEVKEEIKAETSKEIIEALQGKDKTETTDNLNAYERLTKEKLEKENRNPTYAEALELVEEQAVKRMEERQEAAKQKATEQETQAKEFEKQRIDAFNKYVDEQLTDLADKGKLTKIKDVKDEKDRGVIERKALFKTMTDVNEKRAKEGKPVIYSIKEIYYEHYEKPKREVPGADAPVFSGSGHTQADKSSEVDYREIHGKDFLDLTNK